MTTIYRPQGAPIAFTGKSWADLAHDYWEALGGSTEAFRRIAPELSGPHGEGTIRVLEAILDGDALPEGCLTATLVKSAKPGGKKRDKAERARKEAVAAALKSARAQASAAYSEQDHWRALEHAGHWLARGRA